MGPEMANKGVTQGSPLSPLLFNLYVNSIKDYIPDYIKMLQYADDIVLTITGNDVGQLIRMMNDTLQLLNQWSTDHQLRFSPQKSAAMMVGRRSLPRYPVNVVMDGEMIPWVDNYRYLGIVLDNHLTWSKQINNMCQKALKALNILRYIRGTWWGSHPLTMLTFYKAYVRSHLDFGSIIINKCAQYQLNKLDKIQYQSLRVCLGLMKSTPVNIILSEAAELPLDIRRNWLALKFLIKAFSIQNNKVVEAITTNYIHYNYNFEFWTKLAIPPLIEAFDLLRPLINHIEVKENIPYFDKKPIFKKVNFYKLNLNKNMNNSQLFTNEAKDKFPTSTFLFTDGSKDENQRVGIGVFGPENIQFSAGLPPQCSICTAEVYAIKKALEIIENEDIQNTVVLSDSQSALQKITQFMSPKDSSIVLDIKYKIVDLILSGKNIQFGWIPSHTNIYGNDKADHLAKLGSSSNDPLEMVLDYREFLPNIKTFFWDKWTERWKQISEIKGKRYGEIFQKPYRNPWYKNMKLLSRKEIVTMCRIRSNHCLSPQHLFRIKINPNPNCDCGAQGTLHHIFFECPLFPQATDLFIQSFQRISGYVPLNLSSILTASQKGIKIINSFLTSIDRKL